MIKRNSSFKLSKQYKRILATIVDPHKSGEMKRAFIEAQLYSAVQPPREKSKKTDVDN
jgi:hypothetical protein